MKLKTILLIITVLIGQRISAQNYFQINGANPGNIEIKHDGNLNIKSLSLKNTLSIYSSESGFTNRRLTLNTQQGDNSYLYNYDPTASTFHTINIGGSHSLFSGLTILGNGSLGIGIDNPEHILHINAVSPTLRLQCEANNVNGSIIRLTENQLQGAYLQYKGDANRFDVGMHNAQSSLSQDDTPAISILRGNNYVGIGTVSPGYKLDVIGTIRAREVKVDLDGADFVFDDNYSLRTLEEVEQFVKDNKHLPEIEPAKEMKQNGTELGKLNTKLLQKIEELTLYMIEMNKEVKALRSENTELKEKFKKLETAE